MIRRTEGSNQSGQSPRKGTTRLSISSKCLAIIGAGPTGLAIAAKAAVRAELRLPVPHVQVVEKSRVGASWWGEAGYTRGWQRLSTRAEKDLGFPYKSVPAAINERMLSLSWQAHLTALGAFEHWVNEGSLPPLEWQWAKYLEWVADKIKLDAIFAEVRSIQLVDNHWRLTCTSSEGETIFVDAKGLVVTGPGEPRLLTVTDGSKQKLSAEQCAPRVLNCKNFWQHQEALDPLDITDVAIIGSGDGAACIAQALLHRWANKEFRVWIINEQGTLHTRSESPLENQRFSDPEAWTALSRFGRSQTMQRLQRHVSSARMQVLNETDRVARRWGSINQIVLDGDRVHLVGRMDPELPELLDCAIMAIGYDPTWFRVLMGKELAGLVPGATKPAEYAKREEKNEEDQYLPDLSIRAMPAKLHVPMLAGVEQGGGFTDLSCLGRLSDRVLECYTQGELEEHY